MIQIVCISGNYWLFSRAGAVKKSVIDNLLNFLVERLDLLQGSPRDDDGYLCQMSTHCMRKGGAQYRMFHSKSGLWNLTQISSWGGWSNSKNKDNLTKYLVDNMVAKESDMRDLTSPILRDNTFSF